MDQLQSDVERVQKKLRRLLSLKGRRSNEYLQFIAAFEHCLHNLQKQIKDYDHQNE